MKLNELTTIFSGHLFRFKIENSPFGKYRVIQMRNINNDYTINYAGLPRVEINSIRNEQIINKNDIVFRCRGNNNFASIIDCEIENIIADTHFLIIRIKSNIISPEYLAWYLNQKPAQMYFLKNAQGTVIPLITAKILGSLEVTIPDLQTQNKIVELSKISIKEQELAQTIQRKRKLLIENLLIKKIMEANND